MASPTKKAGSDAVSVGASSRNTSLGRTSSYGGTSFTSRTSGAVAARRAARESRDSWMKAPGSTSDPEEKVCSSPRNARTHGIQRAVHTRRDRRASAGVVCVCCTPCLPADVVDRNRAHV